MYWISLCSFGLTWIQRAHLDSLDMEADGCRSCRKLLSPGNSYSRGGAGSRCMIMCVAISSGGHI